MLRIDFLPGIDRGNGIQTIALVTKEIGAKHMTTGLISGDAILIFLGSRNGLTAHRVLG
jgi:hypothetical protein